MRILLSAYACEPHKGSEPGVGWGTALALAERHEVWVLTRANNARAISADLAPARASASLHFAYFDLPKPLTFWKKGPRGVRLYYYLWQLCAWLSARRLHKQHHFHITHHVTFAKYWVPCALAFLPAPFVWGPVGGGESPPPCLWPSGGLAGWTYECLRTAARWLSERDPLVRLTARRAALTIAANTDTARRIGGIGAGNIVVMSQVALSAAELQALETPGPRPHTGVRLVAVAGLETYKGLTLALQAYALTHLPESEFWIIGSGPASGTLVRLAESLHLERSVRFLGQLARAAVFERLKEADIFVFPSLHDSGGYACAEAMAASLPVICLDLGGPGDLVTGDCGFKIAPGDVSTTVRSLASAMQQLGTTETLRRRMGSNARARVREQATWEAKAKTLSGLYERARRQAGRCPE